MVISMHRRRSLRQYGVEVCIVEPSRFGTNIVSPEVTAKGVNSAWDEAPAEAKTEFGEEYFRLCKTLRLQFMSLGWCFHFMKRIFWFFFLSEIDLQSQHDIRWLCYFFMEIQWMFTVTILY